jgi:hypothetical protein
VPARLTGWDFSDVFGGVVNLAAPVVGFALASGGPLGWSRSTVACRMLMTYGARDDT